MRRDPTPREAVFILLALLIAALCLIGGILAFAHWLAGTLHLYTSGLTIPPPMTPDQPPH